MDNKLLGEYIERLKNGDKEAFQTIYNETINDIYRLLIANINKEEICYDLIQEVYLTVHNKIETLQNSEAFRKWIRVITINKMKKYFEKNKREVLLNDDDYGILIDQVEENEEFLPQEILNSNEKRKIIRNIIEELPYEQKIAVYLHYFDELQVNEIAEEMNCSVGTVKSRLNYARKKIKDEVEKWNEKGEKLYSSAIPVLAIIIKENINSINISIYDAEKLLDNIEKIINIGIVASNINGTISSYKKIFSIIKGGKHSLLIKSSIAGMVAVSIISGVIFYNKESYQEPDLEKLYYHYNTLEINGVDKIKTDGDNIAKINNFDEDKCIEIIGENLSSDAEEFITIIDKDGNEKKLCLGVEDGEMYAENRCEVSNNAYIPYKELNMTQIKNISEYDNEIINVNNLEGEKCVEIIPIKAGNTTMYIIGDKNLKTRIEIHVSNAEVEDKNSLNNLVCDIYYKD